jgi:hypothetical protein
VATVNAYIRSPREFPPHQVKAHQEHASNGRYQTQGLANPVIESQANKYRDATGSRDNCTQTPQNADTVDIRSSHGF